jgi:membrane fusion protein, heavy metal efflux system
MSTKTDHPAPDLGHTAEPEPDSDVGPQEETNTPMVEASSSSRSPFVAWLMRSVPTALVFAGLAGIGYWGHHHGWKIPKFSELSGHGELEDDDWCKEHGVPESECIACIADLMPKGKLNGWCKIHGVHECVLEHPEVAELAETPEITQEDLDRAARAIAVRPRTKNDSACKMHLRRIQFASRAAVDKAGIDIGLVDRGRVVESVSATGEIVYDPTLVARLASRAAGTVWRVERNVGDQVKKGDVLALVNAAEVGRAKAELFQSAAQLRLQTKTYERLAGLGTVVAGRRILESETAVAEAEVAVQKVIQTLVNLGMQITYDEVLQTPAKKLKHKIQFLGLPPKIVQQLDPVQTTSNLIPVFAPRDGIVVTRDVVAGEVIDMTRTLFTVADTSRMWLVLNVPLEEAKHVAIGQKVIFRPDGSDHADTGTLTWMSTAVDNETRTVKVRGEVPNDYGHLRNETFGLGEIVLREEEDAIIAPSSAIHWEGCCYVVFVRDKNFMKKGSYKVFHTRSVRPGVIMGDHTEMIAGLLPGEVVVTKGSGVLRAELLKGNLGAG